MSYFMTARSEILTVFRPFNAVLLSDWAEELDQGLFAHGVLIHGISPHDRSYHELFQ